MPFFLIGKNTNEFILTKGTMPCCFSVLCSMEEIDSACQDATNGIPSRRPIIEMTIPSVLDKTISPPGKTILLMHL